MTPTQAIPRRRWYHRYAVLESNIVTGHREIISWHMSDRGARRVVRDLNLEQFNYAAAVGPALDVFEWRALRADHPLVQVVVVEYGAP